MFHVEHLHLIKIFNQTPQLGAVLFYFLIGPIVGPNKIIFK